MHNNCFVKVVGDNSRITCYVEYIILDSIVVSIPACHAGDRGSIPRRGDFLLLILNLMLIFKKIKTINLMQHTSYIKAKDSNSNLSYY